MKSLTKEIKSTLKLAIPISIGHLGHVLTGVADYTMLGHTNPLEMSAATFATSVFFPVMILGLGFALGITPLVAKANGAKDGGKIKALFQTGLKSNIIAGLFLFGLLFFIRDYLDVFKQPENVIAASWDYFLLISLSIIPIMVFSTLKQFVEGLQDTRTPMVMSLVGNVLNILLNFPLIFGLGDFEGLGIVGAGIATLLARSLMVVIFLGYFMYVPKLKEVLLQSFKDLFRFKYFKDVLGIGLPIAIYMFFEVTAFSAATFMMGWISEAHISAHQIALSLASMSFVICMGIGNAGSIRTATFIGEGKIDGVKVIVKSVVFISLSLSFLASFIFIVFKSDLPFAFIDSGAMEVAQYATALLAYAALFQFSDGLQVVFQGLLQGIGDVKIPSVIAVGSYWMIGLPLGYYLAFKTDFGFEGIWMGLTVGLTFSAIFQSLRFRYSYRKLKQTI